MAELDKKSVRLKEPFASSLAISRCTDLTPRRLP